MFVRSLVMTQQEYDILGLVYYIFALCAFWASRLIDVLYNKKGNLDNSKATPRHKFLTWTPMRSGSLVLRIHTHTFSVGLFPRITLLGQQHGIQ